MDTRIEDGSNVFLRNVSNIYQSTLCHNPKDRSVISAIVNIAGPVNEQQQTPWPLVR
jgi:hypothetical protein